MKKKEKNLTITQEEIESNHLIKSTKSYLIVFSILFLSIFLLLIGSLFRTNVNPDYPIVFRDANNHLLVITKNRDLNNIDKIDDADIVYANEDIRYILYTDNKNLYLLDTTSTDNKKILTNNAKTYGFSSDDKYVYYIENNNDLYVYNRKSSSSYLIDSNVTKLLDVSLSYVIYEKDNALLVKDIDSGSVDTVSKSYEDIILSKDGKKMLYSTLNNDETLNYYVYNFNTFANDRILLNIVELLTYNANFTKFMYTTKTEDTINIYNNIKDSLATSDKKFSPLSEDTPGVTAEELKVNQEEAKLVEIRNAMRDYAKNYTVSAYDIYYQNNQTKTLLASSLNQVYLNDITDHKLIYTKMNWDNTFDLASYTSLDQFKEDIEKNKENGLYFQVDTNTPSLIKDSVKDDIEVTFLSGDGIYFKEDTNLYFAKVSSKTAAEAKLVKENVNSSIRKSSAEVGLVYLVKENDSNTLEYVKNGKSSVISNNVNEDSLVISENKDSIYYLKDYENYQGKLMIYNGIINMTISEGVNSFLYINDSLMYATKNYDENSKPCDLYRLNNNKLILVYKGLLKWYNPVETEKLQERNKNS